jgi:hypothetical protein
MNQRTSIGPSPLHTTTEPLEVIAADQLADTCGGMSARDACEIGMVPGSQVGVVTGARLGVRGGPLGLIAGMTIGTVVGAAAGCGVGAAVHNGLNRTPRWLHREHAMKRALMTKTTAIATTEPFVSLPVMSLEHASGGVSTGCKAGALPGALGGAYMGAEGGAASGPLGAVVVGAIGGVLGAAAGCGWGATINAGFNKLFPRWAATDRIGSPADVHVGVWWLGARGDGVRDNAEAGARDNP